MGKDGGGGGNSYDAAYNQQMATLANVTAGMGFNDYLRRYGYQLNPMYGGITNPMASYQIASGANTFNSGAGYTGNATIPTYNQPSTQQGTGGGMGALNGMYQNENGEWLSSPPGGWANQVTTGASPYSGKNGGLMSNVANAAGLNNGMVSGIPNNGGLFTQAVDRYGQPIISAIDLEDQANRLNYQLSPVQQQYLMAGLNSEIGLIPQRGGLESAQIASQMNLLPEQEATALAALQAQQGVIPGQMESVNAQNAALVQRLQAAGNPAQIAADQARARGEATANVQQAFNPAALRTQLTRAGVQGTSGQFTDAMAKQAFERSKALAGARYVAGRDVQQQAKNDQMKLIGTGVSALPTYS